MIGYTLAEIRRLLIKIAQQPPPGPNTPGHGHDGAAGASTRPAPATTGDEATRSLSRDWLLASREAGLPVRAAATLCSVCHQGPGGRHLVRSPMSVRRAWKWRSGWRSMSAI